MGCIACSSYRIREEPDLLKLCTCQANGKCHRQRHQVKLWSRKLHLISGVQYVIDLNLDKNKIEAARVTKCPNYVTSKIFKLKKPQLSTRVKRFKVMSFCFIILSFISSMSVIKPLYTGDHEHLCMRWRDVWTWEKNAVPPDTDARASYQTSHPGISARAIAFGRSWPFAAFCYRPCLPVRHWGRDMSAPKPYVTNPTCTPTHSCKTPCKNSMAYIYKGNVILSHIW